MFRYRCQLRRWAAGALFIWLFGVVSGIANACLTPGLSDRDGAESATAAADVMLHHPMAAMGEDGRLAAHHGEAGGPSDHDGLPGKTNCEDFCDKSIVSIPSLKPSLDGVHGLGLAPSAITTAAPVRPTQPRLVWVPLRDAGGVQSIPIAFLRLTL